MTPATADTPAKLVYLAVQLMYISPDPQVNHGTYFNLMRDIVTAAPSAWPIIEGINTSILSGDLYQALKEARKLVAYEKKLLDQHAAATGGRAARTGDLELRFCLKKLDLIRSPAVETARPQAGRRRMTTAELRIPAPPRPAHRHRICRCGD